MDLQKNFKILILGLVYVSILQINATELVKTCQEFKKTFLEACQLLGNEARTDRMKFLQEHLNLGGSVIFFEIINTAIDDCINALTKRPDTGVKDIIKALNSFKNQINSDEMYDLNTGSVFKREILRSGKTKTIQLPYNATHCYPVMAETPSSVKKD